MSIADEIGWAWRLDVDLGWVSFYTLLFKFADFYILTEFIDDLFKVVEFGVFVSFSFTFCKLYWTDSVLFVIYVLLFVITIDFYFNPVIFYKGFNNFWSFLIGVIISLFSCVFSWGVTGKFVGGVGIG